MMANSPHDTRLSAIRSHQDPDPPGLSPQWVALGSNIPDRDPDDNDIPLEWGPFPMNRETTELKELAELVLVNNSHTDQSGSHSRCSDGVAVIAVSVVAGAIIAAAIVEASC